MRVGCVAFLGNPFVPIMVRMGGFLMFDGLEPGILAGRLIKMPVDTDISRSTMSHIRNIAPLFELPTTGESAHRLYEYDTWPVRVARNVG